MFKKAFKDWSNNTNERQKIQAIFAAIAISMVMIAGLVSLLDRASGMLLLNIAYLAAVVWVVNFVTWAIYLAITTPSNTEAINSQKRTVSRRK